MTVHNFDTPKYINHVLHLQKLSQPDFKVFIRLGLSYISTHSSLCLFSLLPDIPTFISYIVLNIFAVFRHLKSETDACTRTNDWKHHFPTDAYFCVPVNITVSAAC